MDAYTYTENVAAALKHVRHRHHKETTPMTTRHRVWKRHRSDEYLHRDGRTYTRDPEQARKYPADRTHPPQGEDYTDGCWVRA